MRGRNSLGNCAGAQSEEILDLRGGDQHRDAVGESDDDRARNEAHRRAEAGESHRDEQDARHQRDQREAAHSEARHNAGDDDDKCAGGPADLGARAAQRGNQEAGNHRGVEAGLRGYARGDAERHGQRQGHQPDSDAGEQIVQKRLRVIASAKPGLTLADSDCLWTWGISYILQGIRSPHPVYSARAPARALAVFMHERIIECLAVDQAGAAARVIVFLPALAHISVRLV